MLHVREVRTVTRGIELARQPVQSGLMRGIVLTASYIETRDMYLPGSVPATIVQPSAPRILPPPPSLPLSPPSNEFSWVECCFGCEDGHEWYSPAGKGFFIVLLLLVLYLIIGELLLAYFVLFCLLTGCEDE
ncbi:hypothetical protein pdam_00012898 [Pocillopora damicornis]|uniref:Uncharacterized protein n=1 Tax=Pocillopora damicornis TaxID=46731 RepID=A0A3M6U0L8_POCDA|nr:hypothetical protein pdam_00012898 [Pocillopora damicornis]